MHFIEPDNRSQLTFLGKLDDLVAANHPVRLLDLLVDQIVNINLDRFSQKGQVDIGRKAFHPGTLSKLYLYGYCNGISSSRKLEAECHRNIEIIWLLGNLKPDHKTISDYRKDHEEEIRFVTLEFRRFLKEKGYITGKTVSIDGTKIKANANRDMLSLERIENRLEDLQVKLDQYLKKLNANDLEEDLLDEMNEFTDEDSKEFLIAKIIQLQQQIEELSKHKEILVKQQIKTISPTDPDARLMKTRDGRLPGFNAQVIVDGENKMIAVAEITNKQVEKDQLKPVIVQLEEQLQIIPSQVVADTGYYNIVQIQSLESNGETTCYIPPVKLAREQSDQLFNISFTYDPEKRVYYCSQGKPLVLNGRDIAQHNGRFSEKYIGTQCQDCPIKSQCTRSKTGRFLSRYSDKPWVDDFKKRMKSPFALHMIQVRKELSEHVFGTIKVWMGKIPLLVRGLRKVQAEIDIYATSYNFKRLINLKPMEILMEEVRNYSWKAE